MRTYETVAERLRNFRALPDGWDGTENSFRPKGPVNHYVAILLAYLKYQNVPVPRVFPLIEGGYQLQWFQEGFVVHVYNDEKTLVYFNDSRGRTLTNVVWCEFDHFPGYQEMTGWVLDFLDMERPENGIDVRDF